MITNQRGNKVFWNAEADFRLGFTSANRYRYDMDLCRQGWRQYPTEQDDWDYGVWINVSDRRIMIYAKGDRILLECLDPDHLQAELAYLASLYVPPPS